MFDRLIQAGCLLVALFAFGGAALLQPGLDDTRRKWNLVMEPEGRSEKEPLYRLLENAGALRGIAVNALWIRLEDLKQQKRYYEADTLGQRIVELQPRMPEVWRYIAWNMAYNISVKCTTEEERWAWINKAIELLKARGIPNCPEIYTLYYELGWTYQHKIGGESDDVNQYYKLQVARRWHAILGEPPSGKTRPAAGKPAEDAAIAAFRSIAEATSDYVTLDNGVLAPALSAEHQRAFEEKNPNSRRFLEALADVWEKEGYVNATGRPAPGLSVRLAEAVGQVRATSMYFGMGTTQKISPQMEKALRDRLGQDGQAVVSVLTKDLQDPAHPMNQGLAALFPLLTALQIIETERMDPREMLSAMEKWGPLDWRHPNAHAIYWVELGQKKAGIRDQEKKGISNKYVRLNSDRVILHSTQALMDSGRVFYDPVLGTVSHQPDPRFIQPYGDAQAMMRANLEKKVYTEEDGVQTGTPLESLKKGEENFLHRAIQVSYMFGDEADARRYYDEVRTKFPESQNYAPYYGLSLDDFVAQTLRQDQLGVVRRSAVLGLLTRAIEEGFLKGNGPKAQRLDATAQKTHASVAEDLKEAKGVVVTAGSRQEWPAFEVFRMEAVARFLTESRYSLRERAVLWFKLPNDLKLELFPIVQAQTWRQVDAAGFGVTGAEWFPPPEGWEKLEAERAKQQAAQAGPSGDRQR